MKYQKFRALLTCMLVWLLVLCAEHPALALEPLAFRLPVAQQIDVPRGTNAEDVTVQYRLTPIDGAPLPEGAADERFLFSIKGNGSADILFQFQAEGYHSYTLEMTAVDGVDPERVFAAQDTYTLVISAFSPEASASLYGADGRKYAALSYQISDPGTPSPTPTAEPTPTATPTPTAEPTPTATPTPTAEPTPTATPTPTVEPTPTAEPSVTPTPAAPSNATPPSAPSGSPPKTSVPDTPKTGDTSGLYRWLLLMCAAGACALLLGWRLVCRSAHGERT